MPNGGSDCCGTCRFNRANAGLGDHGPLYREDMDCVHEASHCEIRGLDIENPFWTYCANHTSRMKRGYSVPLGPVYVHEWNHVVNSDGVRVPVSNRIPWVDAPDTEEVRTQLLRFLEELELLSDSYPWHGKHLGLEVVNELERLREPRAIPILEQIAKDLREKGEEPDGIRNVIERIQSAVEKNRGGQPGKPDTS
ncbi:MAG: hypothetical protein F4207_00155 [Gemmatimonadetes bacterium]|nr:hypothetical protein [Gemmatimonadota bacterium]MYG14826.1 hypothetical protein [Gemmatimonadota bacterium]